MIIGRAIYRDGERAAEPAYLSDMNEMCRASGGIVWVGPYRPTSEEFDAVARERPLAVMPSIGVSRSHAVVP